jgi:hypothetical protein
MATYESRRYNTPVPDASKIADGSVNNTEFQHLDGVTSDIQSQFTGKLPLAGGTMTGDLNFGDNVDINVGAGADLKILHDGSNSTIQNTTGTLKVLADTLQLKNNADNETLATFANGGAANLRFNNGTKLETTNTGVNVTGELGATGNITAGANVNGNGQNLTNLNASNLASGTVPDARLPASALSSDWVKIATSESGSNVANLSFIGTYSDYRHLKVMLHGKWQNMNNNASYLSFRVSLNASNFSTSQIYHFTHLFMSTNAGNFSYFGSGATQAYFSRWNPYGNQGDKTMSSEITLFGINETNAHKAFIANGGSWDRSQSGDVHYNLAGGTINSASAIRGIQLFHADGANISAGCGATLYGIK